MKYFILFLFVLTTNAVSAAVGCINASRTRIYTDLNSGQSYWKDNNSNNYITSSTGCLYVYTGGICSIGSNGANNGYLGDTTAPQECPIDTNTFILIISSVGFGAFMIRKKREANFSSK